MTNTQQKFKKQTTDYIKQVIHIAHLLGIEGLIIDSESARGSSQESALGILSKFPANTVHEFDTIAISRVATLRSRMQLLGEDFDIIPEYKTLSDGKTLLYRIKLKKGKTSIEFKCANPAQIKTKKNINDAKCFTFRIESETIKILNRISSAMSTETVTFSSNDGNTVNINISDGEGDIFNHLVSDTVQIHLPETKKTFTTSLKLKTLITLFKEEKNGGIDLDVTQRGLICLKIHNIDCFVFPEVD